MFTNLQSGYLNVYPSNGPFPDLLTTIDNGLGGVTGIQYTPSTKYQNTFLPFVNHVVSSVTVSDGKGNSSTTTFDYSGGYYSADEKEFRGFQYVKSTAPNGTVTELWFHQDDVYKGLMYKQVITDSLANTYTWTENIYEELTSPYSGVYYPVLSQTDTYIYDGDNVATPRHIINTFTYDDYGNMTSKSYAENPSQSNEKTEHTDYNYDPANWIMSLPHTKYIRDRFGTLKAQTWYEYYPDGKGNLKKKQQRNNTGANPITIYDQYDPYGNIKKIIDPRGYPANITYDSTTYTHPIEIKNALNHVTQMTYDFTLGKLKTMTDPNNNTIIYDYDEFGRLIKITNPAPYGITEYKYQNYGDPYIQKVREEAQDRYGVLIHFKETYFDGLGRTTAEKAGGPNATTIIVDTEYNNKGLVWKKSLPSFEGNPVYKTTYAYDPVDRLIYTLNPDNTASAIDYDRGRVTYIDANGHKKVAEKDIYERIVKIEEYAGTSSYALYATTIYQYDVLDNLTKVIDAQNNQTIITYDSLSRKISMNDPDMGYWTYEYDANGNLRYQTDAKLQRIEFQYDALNRVEKKIYPDATFIEYRYDETFSTNYKGRLTTLIDLVQAGTTKFYYDVMGQITKTEKTISPITYTTQTQYDALGRAKKIIYPDYTEVGYTYDGHGNIKDIKSGLVTYANYPSYTAIGNPLLVTYGNGVGTVYQYYPQNNRLFSITTSKQTTGFMNLAYDYDNVGNITSITDLLDSNKTRTYVYDDLDRLIEADSPSYSGKLLYQYDKIGNMTYNCKYGYYFYDDPKHKHAVTRVVKNGVTVDTYTYDDNGNMISGAGRTLTYDYDNRPTSIVTGSGATISVYDAMGMRVQKMVPTPITTTYIGQMYECDNTECTKYIFSGSQRIANIKGADTFYYHADHLQSSTVITDNAGNNVEQMFYYPYGEIHTDFRSLSVKHKFTGHEYDAETGLIYMGARYYDPKLARFISADTIVPLPFYPQSLNRYSYTINNPLILRELNGNFFESTTANSNGSYTLGWSGSFSVPSAPPPTLFTPNIVNTVNSWGGSGIAIGGVTSGYEGGSLGSSYHLNIDTTLHSGNVQATINLLGQLIFAEAGKEYDTKKAMEAVGSVVRNRVNSSNFPDTYSDVIYQQGQFESVGGKEWNKFLNPDSINTIDRAARNRALTVAEGIYNGTISDPTNGAVYFHSIPPAQLRQQSPWFYNAMQSGRISESISKPIGSFYFYK